MTGVRKDWRRFILAAEEAGWRIRRARGHAAYVMYPQDPAHPPVTIPSTPKSNARALENKRAELRRAGLNV